MASFARPATGAITAAMRAARAGEGPRVLRLARVEQGRIVDERVLNASTTIDGARVVRRGERWELELLAGAHARVADAEGARTWSGTTRFSLAPDARGKIVCGDVAHLFQVVVAAPRVTPQLPLTVLARAERIDVRFAMVAAVSLLVHFGFVGAVQADFMDPTIDEDHDAATLVVEAKARPTVAMEEKVEIGDATPEPNTPKQEPSAPAADDGPAHPTPALHAGPPKPAGETLDALDAKLNDLGLTTISSMQQGGPPKPSKSTESQDGTLDEIAKKTNGTDVDGPPIKGDTTSAGPIAGTTKPGFDVGETKTKPIEAKPAPTTEPTVKPNEPSIPPATGNTPKDVDSVIAKNRWRFRACYAKELNVHPDASGTVKLRVNVGDDGSVSDVSIVSSDFSPSLNACVTNAFKSMKFASDEHTCLFAVPVTLTQPGK